MQLRFIAAIAGIAAVLYSTPAPTDSAAAAHGMVVTEQRLASAAGLDVLRRGGNAVDAAVAVAYTLAVVDPCCGNIGGGGFMLVHTHDGRERFIDFREKAPMRATRDMFLDANGIANPAKSQKGWLAIGVPGTVMGMERARSEFGTMSRAALLRPAIDLAKTGFVLVPGDLITFAGSAEGYSGAYSFQHQPNVRAIWMPHGALPRAGERIVQTDLARSLQLIADGGAAAFYDGPIARAIVDATRKGGGVLTVDDFRRYTVDESPPVHCAFHGYTIVSAAPPSSGGTTLCETLNIIAPFPLARWGWHSDRETHYVVEAERRAYADRNAYLGDPAYVKNPVSQLIDPAYAAKLRASIDPSAPTPSKDVKPGLDVALHENTETTHFSIVDKDGNAVGVTYTLNDWFGSGVIAGSTGFFLNDEMDDFTAKPGIPNMYGLVQGERNDIAPGKRPLSSMTPTIVVQNGKPVMVTGSPGGSRIITTVLETLLNVLEFHQTAQQAVDAPRMHMQWLPDQIDYEPGAFPAPVMESLRAKGYAFHEVPFWGSAQAITIDPVSGALNGGTDRRHPAGAVVEY